MFTKFANKMRFNLLTAFILFLLFTPAASILAQNTEESDTETEVVDNNNTVILSPDSLLKASFKAIIKPPKNKAEVELNGHFYFSLVIDLAMLLLIIGTIYYPNYKKLDTVFTFALFNVAIFLLTFLLNQVKISMGAAFGLFAVFSMLRYRTAGISVKDMTYLFIFITMGLLSGIQLQVGELLIVFGIIFIMILLLDTKILIKRESTKIVFFEDINLIHADKEKELIEELKIRTGLNVHRISIEEISYLRDSATITIYYYE
ncbi:conserved membrane hypothetical protein [uncultured Paludibacter sp.]|nr:conserved membrane hypothetical protein [uncultured Paludibacter sp.]